MLLHRAVNHIPHDGLEQFVLRRVPYESIDTGLSQGYWVNRSRKNWVGCQGVV